MPVDFTKDITIDPDDILSEIERNPFQVVNKKFNSVFNPTIGTYNDKSGKIRASVCMGNNIPSPKKKVKYHVTIRIIRHKFDELVNLGTLSRPEDVNINITY